MSDDRSQPETPGGATRGVALSRRDFNTVLGLGGTRTLRAVEIASIDPHINMQTQGRYGTPYYEVRARLTNGRKVSLGDGIRNKRHAEWLAAQMRAAIGMRQT